MGRPLRLCAREGKREGSVVEEEEEAELTGGGHARRHLAELGAEEAHGGGQLSSRQRGTRPSSLVKGARGGAQTSSEETHGGARPSS